MNNQIFKKRLGDKSSDRQKTGTQIKHIKNCTQLVKHYLTKTRSVSIYCNGLYQISIKYLYILQRQMKKTR